MGTSFAEDEKGGFRKGWFAQRGLKAEIQTSRYRERVTDKRKQNLFSVLFETIVLRINLGNPQG